VRLLRKGEPAVLEENEGDAKILHEKASPEFTGEAYQKGRVDRDELCYPKSAARDVTRTLFLHRVLLEEVFRTIESGEALHRFTDRFDFGRLNRSCLVAPGVADIGQGSGELFVVEDVLERGHRNDSGILDSLDFDGSHQALERKLDKAVL
jgi:hypothetical protein